MITVGGHKTADIAINPDDCNNCLYNPTGTYNISGKQRISYDNSNTNWSDVYAYVFNNGDDALSSWPGIKITKNILTNKTFFLEINQSQHLYKYVIFNNGNGSQTDDLFIPSGSDLIYDGTSGYEWWPCNIADTSSSDNQRIYLSLTFNAFQSGHNSGRPMYAKVWNSTVSASSPGQLMTRLDPNNSGSKIYWVDLDKAPGYYTFVKFNNGSNETGALDLPSDSNIIYMKGWKVNTIGTGSWSKITMTTPSPSHTH